jgi:Icc-related predicted phosphoesterase
MKITLDEIEPIESYSYLEVGAKQSNNGKPIILHKELPIYLGEFENEKSNVDFLIICSDLQGAIEKDGEYKLVGEELPEFLKLLIDIEFTEKENPKIGVLLCGDLFTSLDKRGSSGDVRDVWMKFKDQFRWVVGVAGNHDRFGSDLEKEEFKATENIYLLHKEIKEIDNLRIGGISGIIGRGDKIHRVAEKEYLDNFKKLLKKELDFVILHETPDFPDLEFIGNPKIREVIEKENTSNICCGHCHWRKTLIEFENKSVVINVDSKVVILKKKNKN